MKTKMKKVLAVVLIMAIAMSMFTVCAFAAPPEPSPGTIIGGIIFFPFILVDSIIYAFTGIHVFYWWW